jgi:hypothetical protein
MRLRLATGVAIHAIERDVGIHHGAAARAVIAALRDYATRAGWTGRATGNAWIAAAQAAFPLRQRGKRDGQLAGR